MPKYMIMIRRLNGLIKLFRLIHLIQNLTLNKVYSITDYNIFP